VCNDCYRIRNKSIRDLAEKKWGKVGQQKPDAKSLPMPDALTAPQRPALARTTDPDTSRNGTAAAPGQSSCQPSGAGFQPRRLLIQYAPFHFSLWLSHESRQRRN
jgi:hypothetical protein